MNLTIERSTLLAALTKIGGIVSRKATVPILSHILITAHKDGRLIFRATNLDMEATVTTTADVHAEGSTCALADVLLNIAKNSAAGAEIHFDLGARLVVKSGRSRFQVSVLSPADFPTFADINGGQAFTITGAELDRMLGRVAFSQGIDAGRFALCGVNFAHDGDVMYALATDAKRAAVISRAFDAHEFGIVVPSPMVAEITRACAGLNLDVEVTIAPEKIKVDAGETVIISKLIDCQYSDYRRIVPHELPHELIVNRLAIEAAVRRVMVAIEDTARSCKMIIGDGLIKLTSRGQDLDAADEIECGWSGPEISIGVNSAQLLAAIMACGSDDVLMRLLDADTAFKVQAPGEDAFFSIIMPLKS